MTGENDDDEQYEEHWEPSASGDEDEATDLGDRHIFPGISTVSSITPQIRVKLPPKDRKLDFPFLNEPPLMNIIYAASVLRSLDASDDDGNLTAIGKRMAFSCMPPHLARVVYAAEAEEITAEGLKIAAMCEDGKPPLQLPFEQEAKREACEKWREMYHDEKGIVDSDHMAYLNMFDEFVKGGETAQTAKQILGSYSALQRAVKVNERLRHVYWLEKKLKQMEDDGENSDNVDFEKIRKVAMIHTTLDRGPAFRDKLIKALLKGYFLKVAHLGGRGYVLPRDRYVRGGLQVACKISPTSVLYEDNRPKTVVFNSGLNRSLSGVTIVQLNQLPAGSISRMMLEELEANNPGQCKSLVFTRCPSTTGRRTCSRTISEIDCRLGSIRRPVKVSISRKTAPIPFIRSSRSGRRGRRARRFAE